MKIKNNNIIINYNNKINNKYNCSFLVLLLWCVVVVRRRGSDNNNNNNTALIYDEMIMRCDTFFFNYISSCILITALLPITCSQYCSLGRR